MKQNTTFLSTTSTEVSETLDKLARGLLDAVTQFDLENGPPVHERTVRLAFANAIYLHVTHPDDAASLLAELRDAGVTDDRGDGVVVAAFEGFAGGDGWITEAGELLAKLWADVPGDRSDDVAAVRAILFAVAAGLVVAIRFPEVAKRFEGRWNDLNSETKFLAARLIRWRLSGWVPQHPAFVEFTAGFYKAGSLEQRVLTRSVAGVFEVACGLSDTWSVTLWSETGWRDGRRVAEEMPETRRELIADVPPADLAVYLRLYQLCIVETAARDGTVRPERAALRYFGVTARDIYARTFCRGDQPRFIARAAYDLTFWMGLLSTQPIPVAGN